MSPKIQALSRGDQLLLEKIRERIRSEGRAHMSDLGKHAADQIRLLQTLDVIERVGDDLRLVTG
jgi:hypothetical protein